MRKKVLDRPAKAIGVAFNVQHFPNHDGPGKSTMVSRIPQLNNSKEDLKELCNLVLPYHGFGKVNYTDMGKACSW